MNFSIAEDDIKLISVLLDLWKQQGNLSDIEYDLLLDKLKNLYVQVKFGRTPTESTVDSQSDIAEVAESLVGAAVAANVNATDVPKPQSDGFLRRDNVRKKVLSLYDEDEIPAVDVKVPVVAVESEPVRESAAKVAETIQPVPEPKSEYISPEITARPSAINENITAPVVEEHVVSAPVVEEPAASVTPVPAAPAAPAASVAPAAPVAPASPSAAQTAGTQTIGDQTFGGQTIGDILASRTATIADSVQVAGLGTNQFASVVSLRDAIGFNDKYMFVRELFGGSEDLYAQTIAQLDNFTSIEDALIYIYDNFGWTRDNEAACRLFDILDAKLK